MKKSKVMALCGVLAALAIVIMCFGSMLPFMTYVCPVICICITQFVLKLCGKSAAWTWYAAVCILSLLLCPDKEAAAIFAALGYYPMIKVLLEKLRISWLLKFVYFNLVIVVLYWLLMNVLGMGQLAEEFSSLGTVMTVITLVLGNLVFWLIDNILGRMSRKIK